jgi:hypothetical protein
LEKRNGGTSRKKTLRSSMFRVLGSVFRVQSSDFEEFERFEV